MLTKEASVRVPRFMSSRIHVRGWRPRQPTNNGAHCPHLPVVGVPADHINSDTYFIIFDPQNQHMYFFTATINSWQHLLQDDGMKDIIIDSLRWLSDNKKVFTHGFVIMPNHVHILWSYGDDERYNVPYAFLSFTAHKFKKELKENAQELLAHYSSTQADREYHFWERRSRSIEVKSRVIAFQKLDYIHHNPLQEKWKLAELPEGYKYSSARFYMQIEDEFSFLKHVIEF